MQQTENYGLNLWNLSDRIQMEDFNSDNRKLDAALAALAAGMGGLEVRLNNMNQLDPGWLLGIPLWSGGTPRWEEFNFFLFSGNVINVTNGGTPYFSLNAGSETIVKFPFQEGGYLCLLIPCKTPSRLADGTFISAGNVQSFQVQRPVSDITYWRVGCDPTSGVTPIGVTPTASFTSLRCIGIR